MLRIAPSSGPRVRAGTTGITAEAPASNHGCETPRGPFWARASAAYLGGNRAVSNRRCGGGQGLFALAPKLAPHGRNTETASSAVTTSRIATTMNTAVQLPVDCLRNAAAGPPRIEPTPGRCAGAVIGRREFRPKRVGEVEETAKRFRPSRRRRGRSAPQKEPAGRCTRTTPERRRLQREGKRHRVLAADMVGDPAEERPGQAVVNADRVSEGAAPPSPRPSYWQRQIPWRSDRHRMRPSPPRSTSSSSSRTRDRRPGF